MWIAFVGCVSSSPAGPGSAVGSALTGVTGETGSLPSIDTAARPCEAGVTTLPRTLCVETDAGPYPRTEQDLFVVGTVTEVGGALPPVAGSDVIGDSDRCTAIDTHQVRVVDGAGHSWTIGWGVGTAVDDASADAISPGAAVSLTVRSGRTNPNVASVAFLLADTGPLVFAEQVSVTALLSVAERGGIAADVAPYGETCVGVDTYGRAAWLQTVTFTGPAGSATLDSGEAATFALGDRDLALVLAEASVPGPGGGDGGSFEVWIGWKAP